MYQRFLGILMLVLAPLCAIALLILGTAFFLSFTTLRLENLGYSHWVVGMVHSAYYFGLLIGAAKAEELINRVGHVRAYAGYAGLMTCCVMLQGLFVNPALWMVLRCMMGFCLAVFYIVVETWFLHTASAKTRGVILSFYMATLYVFQGLSQFILEKVPMEGPQAFYISAFLGSASLIPLALMKAQAPELHPLSGYSFRSLFNQSHFGFMGCLLSGVILSSIYSFGPLFAQGHGLSVSTAMCVCIFGGGLLQWPVGFLSDILDRRKVLFGVTLSTLVIGIIFALLAPKGVLVYFMLFILGGLVFTLYPLSIAQVCDRLQPEHITKATGMLLLSYSVGSVVGPLVAPVFLKFSPENGLFIFISTVACLLAAIGGNSFFLRPAVPEEMQTDFVPLPRVSPVAYDLDPRADESLVETDKD